MVMLYEIRISHVSQLSYTVSGIYGKAICESRCQYVAMVIGHIRLIRQKSGH